LKTFLLVFLSVFLAELGDKTQVATLLFATDQNLSRVGVFAAASTALVFSSLLAVLFGAQISRLVAPSALKALAGLGFLAIGMWMLIGSRS
jgi:putative Ca2+/H+ antiporter (TMEM165/GDT1 family)